MKLGPMKGRVCHQCEKVFDATGPKQRFCCEDCREMWYFERNHNRGPYLLFERDNFSCIYCGASPISDPTVELQMDHIVSRAAGGSDRFDNMVTACDYCNNARGMYHHKPEVLERLLKEVKRRNAEAGISDDLLIVTTPYHQAMT